VHRPESAPVAKSWDTFACTPIGVNVDLSALVANISQGEDAAAARVPPRPGPRTGIVRRRPHAQHAAARQVRTVPRRTEQPRGRWLDGTRRPPGSVDHPPLAVDMRKAPGTAVETAAPGYGCRGAAASDPARLRTSPAELRHGCVACGKPGEGCTGDQTGSEARANEFSAET